MVKNLPAKEGDIGDLGSIPGSGRSGEGMAPTLVSCLENPRDRGVRLAADHGVARQHKRSNLIPMHVKVLYGNSQVSRRELGFHSRARRSH